MPSDILFIQSSYKDKGITRFELEPFSCYTYILQEPYTLKMAMDDNEVVDTFKQAFDEPDSGQLNEYQIYIQLYIKYFY